VLYANECILANNVHSQERVPLLKLVQRKCTIFVTKIHSNQNNRYYQIKLLSNLIRRKFFVSFKFVLIELFVYFSVLGYCYKISNLKNCSSRDMK